jgi:hypothetical protein
MTQAIEIDAVLELNSVLEEMIYLSEVRGELSPEANALTERRLAQLTLRYAELQPKVMA